MKKVYCRNCKYNKVEQSMFFASTYCVNPINIDVKDCYYKPNQNITYLYDQSTLNKNNNCKLYKRKWWKFWVKEERREILKGIQSKTDAGPKPDVKEKIKTLDADFIKKYLDDCIVLWRNKLKKAKTKEDELIAKCNIDCSQSIRITLFGELLPKEKE